MDFFIKSDKTNKKLDTKLIFSNLNTKFAGNRLIYKFCVSSTNDIAKEYFKTGISKNGDVFLTDKQTRGRGRTKNREWKSETMQDIALSLLISDFEFLLKNITLIVGIAIMDALKDMSFLEARLKWPNDVYIGGKKVCGVLCERINLEKSGAIVIGIGVNVNSKNFPDKLSNSSTSLYLEKGKYFTRENIITKILNKMEHYLTDAKLNNEKFINKYRENCVSINKKAVFCNRWGKKIHGKIIDISQNGELIVLAESGNTMLVNSSCKIKWECPMR